MRALTNKQQQSSGRGKARVYIFISDKFLKAAGRAQILRNTTTIMVLYIQDGK